MRMDASGGIYGKPFSLQLTDAEGQHVTLTGDEARSVHTEAYRRVKGPERDDYLREEFARRMNR